VETKVEFNCAFLKGFDSICCFKIFAQNIPQLKAEQCSYKHRFGTKVCLNNKSKNGRADRIGFELLEGKKIPLRCQV